MNIIKAEQIKIGTQLAEADGFLWDVIVWNYGYTSTVVDLIPSKTGKTITCMLKSNQDGVIRERKMGAERLVAIA